MLTFNFSKHKIEDTNGLMLDVGCGEGRHIFGVMESYPQMKCIGIDPHKDSLKKDNPNIHLIVIGSLKKGGHTERLIKELNIKDNVFFKKHISKEEIRRLYSTSSVAIVSSLYEGFGYPVIEAMSCEVPLIATNVSSIPELVGKYGLLIDPKDENLLSNKIKNVLSNYDEHKKTAIQGRQHIIKTFNWSKITNEYEKTIYKVIENFRKC